MQARVWLGVVLSFGTLLCCQTASTQSSPAGDIIDECAYPNDAAARQAWHPMRGSAEAEMAALDGGQSLRLPCRFAGQSVERASWDRTGQFDLSLCRGVEFQLFCRDASPVSYFSLYLQSGAGWYHASFYPESTTAWNTVRLDKSVFATEGQPAGWDRIRTIRLSAWRGEGRDTELFIRNLRMVGRLGADAHIALLRCDSAAQRPGEDARSISQILETTAALLDAAGLGYAVLSDLGLTTQQLAQARVVVLPHNPILPEPAAKALAQYAGEGGKLLVCYSVPASLRPVMHVSAGKHIKDSPAGLFSTVRARPVLTGAPTLVRQHSWNIDAVTPVAGSTVLADWLDDRGQPSGYAAIVGSTNTLVLTHVFLPDDREQKSRLLLAMVGHLAPELWEQAAQRALSQAPRIAASGNFEEAGSRVAALAANNSRAEKTLAESRKLRDQALKLQASGQFGACIEKAAAAREQLREAWCLAQRAEPGEFRGFWCHSAFGVEGMPWDTALQRLGENGFNAIFPNMLWGGAAFYESKVLPVATAVRSRGDQIAACIAAARKHGVQVHVWKVNWNLGHAAPREFLDRMRSEHRLQASFRGVEEPWLCPSHLDNQRLEIDAMLEVARKYDVDGLHFDYIRYPDADHCFCPGCKERFEKATGTTVTKWPGDLRTVGPLRDKWLEWRRGNITEVVKSVAEQAHALKPKLKISAAVFRNWTTDRDGVGQDWKLWCERGWVDFVCPMDYTSSSRQFSNMVSRQVQWAGRTPVYPGIGESASSSRLDVEQVIEQIGISRRHKTGGFLIFNYGPHEAAELVPMLGLGATRMK